MKMQIRIVHSLDIGCLSIHETLVTANNFTNNNVVFFFVSDLKIVLSNY